MSNSAGGVPVAQDPTVAAVGQLVMVDFTGREPDAMIERLIVEAGIGGVILFAKNVRDAAQVARLTNALQRIAASAGRPPLLVAIDQEGGPVVRLREAAFPGAMAFAAAGDLDLAGRAAQATGRALRAVGVHVNCAPVLDVNNNPENPVIGVRSYGEDPEAVARFGIRTMTGLEAAGVLAVPKHFPGHGDTSDDSHLFLPTVSHSRSRLDAVELRPFREAIRAGARAVMTSHVRYPALDPDWPATLSMRILGMLREEFGFAGLVFSDSMRMHAITHHHAPGAAAVQAVRAGVDVVLALGEGAMQKEAIAALQAAASGGAISAAQLEAAAARVRVVKERLCPAGRALVAEEEVGARVDAAAVRALAERVAEAAATLVMDPLGTLPLRPGPVRVATGAAAPRTAERLAEALRGRGRAVTVGGLDADAGPNDGAIVVPVGEEAPMQDRSIGPLASHERVAAVTHRARERGAVVVVSTSIPYLLAHAAHGCAGLAVYGADDASLQAAARVLTGEIQARGRLPVTVAVNPSAAHGARGV